MIVGICSRLKSKDCEMHESEKMNVIASTHKQTQDLSKIWPILGRNQNQPTLGRVLNVGNASIVKSSIAYPSVKNPENGTKCSLLCSKLHISKLF